MLVEKDGRHAVVVPDHKNPGRWRVVTARMGNAMGSAEPYTKHPHDGPNDNLTKQEAERQAQRWERFLADECSASEASESKRR